MPEILAAYDSFIILFCVGNHQIKLIINISIFSSHSLLSCFPIPLICLVFGFDRLGCLSKNGIFRSNVCKLCSSPLDSLIWMLWLWCIIIIYRICMCFIHISLICMIFTHFCLKCHDDYESMHFILLLKWNICVINEINHFGWDLSEKTPIQSDIAAATCLKYFVRKKSVWDTQKTELKIEIKRLACGKYLSRYPNISTVCLVAFDVSWEIFFFTSLSMWFCFETFQVQVENSPSNAVRNVSVELPTHWKTKHFWHSEWNQCHQNSNAKRIICFFEHRNCFCKQFDG